MKYLIITFFLTASINLLQAQFSFNAGVGTMNYAGDLQDKSITFSECKYGLSLGASYQYGHLVGNLNFTYGKIGADDSKNGDRWFYRNLNFQSVIYEAALTAEYDVFDISGAADDDYFNTEYATKKYTPYLFAGVGMFNFNPYTFYNGQKVFLAPLRTEGQAVPYQQWGLSIPFGLGFKYAVSDNITIGAEMNIRKTFTDYVDDVSHFNFVDTTVLLNTSGPLAASLSYRADEIPGTKYPFSAQRGNDKKKDVYYTFAVKVMFRFGGGPSLFKYGYGN